MTRFVGRLIVLSGALLLLGSVAVLIGSGSTEMEVSSDDGAPALALWAVVLPQTVGIVLALLLPRRAEPMPAVPVRRGRLALTTIALVALAIAFPVAVQWWGLDDEYYVLLKFVMFMVLPALVVLIMRKAVRIEWRSGAWRWWGPIIAVGAWTLLSQAAPWRPRADFSPYDLEFLIVAAIATAITAGIGEELFYRRWLQTRFEAALGPWPGIALASLLFALMHLGSHGSGDLVHDVALVIVAQGTFGLFMGVLWWRYRNLTMIVVAHVITNGWAVAAYLIGLT